MLQTSPTEVKDGLTDSLTLRCDVNDTGSSSASLVGRDLDPQLQPDVTSTTVDVQEVTSMVLILNGKDLASVSRKQGASVMDGSGNVKVTGAVDLSPGERRSGVKGRTSTMPVCNRLVWDKCDKCVIVFYITVTAYTTIMT